MGRTLDHQPDMRCLVFLVNNDFTVAVTPGSEQAVERGGLLLRTTKGRCQHRDPVAQFNSFPHIAAAYSPKAGPAKA